MRTVRASGLIVEDVVIFEAPDDVDIQVVGSGPDRDSHNRGGAGTPEDLSGGRALREALAASGFDLVAEARLEPSGRAFRSEDGPCRVQVQVRPGESAVVLVESEDGTYAWLQAEGERQGCSVRGTEADVLTFTVGTPAASGRATRSFTGWLVDTVTKPIRTLVLKFAVGLTIDGLVGLIERKNVTGLVHLEGEDAATWRPGIVAIPSRTRGPRLRVLLMVHGTFSDTAGSFGHLGRHAQGRRLLKEVYRAYDIVLGFDHKTLAESVEANAQAFAEALSTVPDDAEIDAVAYSRGGLVLRALFDKYLPAAGRPLRLRRAVFVGCTNAGTHLASPANWEALADLYTNIIMAGARVAAMLGGGALDPFVRLGIKTMGEFVQMLPQVAINDRRVPGLASMAPDSAIVAELNRVPPSGQPASYHAITSNFAPVFEPERALTGELAQLLLDRVTNRLWQGEDNDLVVDTASMTSFGARSGWLVDTFLFGNVETIYHTVYFTAHETCEKLLAWLDLPPLPPALARPRREREAAPFDGPANSSLGPADDPLPGEPPRRSTREAVSLDADEPAASSRSYGGAAAPPAAAPAPARPQPCHVAASMPETPSLSREARLEVTLSREEIARQVGQARADATLLVEDDARLEVLVSGRINCDVVGRDSVEVDAPKPGSPEVAGFKICGLGPGPAELWVDIYREGRRLSRLVLQPVFVSSRDTVAQALVAPEDVDKPVVELRILEEGSEDDWRLRFLISAPELDVEDSYESAWQTVNKVDYVTGLYKKLEQCWARNAGDFEALMEEIKAQGADLFRLLLPEPMQRRIWDLREKIGSLQVLAQEPSIPWEIAFVAEPGKPLTNGKFFAELGLTRWITNVGVAPAALRLRQGKALYCIPEYLDGRFRLPSQPKETEMLQTLLGATPVVPRITPLLSLLRGTDAVDFDLLHFACHGSADGSRIWESGLLLQGFMRDGKVAREELSVALVRNNASLAREGAKPIVFLNACQSAVSGQGLSGTGGLAQTFVRAGAGLFVGTLWSVEDRTALAFASTFYSGIKDGRTVAQAAKAAREQARKNGESTWLAYSIYGHPYARASG